MLCFLCINLKQIWDCQDLDLKVFVILLRLIWKSIVRSLMFFNIMECKELISGTIWKQIKTQTSRLGMLILCTLMIWGIPFWTSSSSSSSPPQHHENIEVERNDLFGGKGLPVQCSAAGTRLLETSYWQKSCFFGCLPLVSKHFKRIYAALPEWGHFENQAFLAPQDVL